MSLHSPGPNSRRATPGGGWPALLERGGKGLPRLAGVAVTLLLLSSCSFKTPQSTLDPHGLVARDQLSLFYITVWVSLFIFVTVGGAMALVVWKYREKPGDENKPMPAQGHGNPLIEIGLITASIALLVIIAVPTLKAIFLTDALPTDQPYWKTSLLGSWYNKAGGNLPAAVENQPLIIDVHGWQWWWSFDYTQFGFTTANEFVMPAGKVVEFKLRSNNVIHSFWLPKIAGKVDLIPGRNNEMWMMPDELIVDKDGKVIQEGADTYENGLYYGQCAQYCGESHAFMLFRARVVSDKDFVEWVNKSLTPVAAPAADGKWGAFLSGVNPDEDSGDKPNPTMLAKPEQRGAALFFGRGSCIQCHKIDGSPSTALLGPNLSHVASRTSLASGFLDNLDNKGKMDANRQQENFYNWITHPNDIKPGNLMWNPQPGSNAGGLRDIVQKNKDKKTPLTEADWHDLAAYLMTLK